MILIVHIFMNVNKLCLNQREMSTKKVDEITDNGQPITTADELDAQWLGLSI